MDGFVGDEELWEILDAGAALQRVAHAVSHPVRRYVLDLLVHGAETATSLAGSASVHFGISASRASQHLQVLADAGLVHVEADGTWRTYGLNERGFDELTEWIRSLQ